MKGNPVSGMKENFAIGIRNLGFWDPEFNSRNLESHQRLESRIQVRLTNSGLQYLESGIHGVESKIQDCTGFLGRSIQNLSRVRLTRTSERKAVIVVTKENSF